MEVISKDQENPENQQNISDIERWAVLIGGGALMLSGRSRGSLPGAIAELDVFADRIFSTI